jgi:hypothetical protein
LRNRREQQSFINGCDALLVTERCLPLGNSVGFRRDRQRGSEPLPGRSAAQPVAFYDDDGITRPDPIDGNSLCVDFGNTSDDDADVDGNQQPGTKPERHAVREHHNGRSGGVLLSTNLGHGRLLMRRKHLVLLAVIGYGRANS